MHPLHEDIARLLGDQVKARSVVVWYDQRGEFRLPAPPSKVARSIFGALQGALLVKRATGDISQINDVVAVIKLQLASPA